VTDLLRIYIDEIAQRGVSSFAQINDFSNAQLFAFADLEIAEFDTLLDLIDFFLEHSLAQRVANFSNILI
jgi:hypothetical protein